MEDSEEQVRQSETEINRLQGEKACQESKERFQTIFE
jgi:hypothetical protein